MGTIQFKSGFNEQNMTIAAEKVQKWHDDIVMELAEIFGESIDVITSIDVFALLIANILTTFQEGTECKIDLGDIFKQRFNLIWEKHQEELRIRMNQENQV